MANTLKIKRGTAATIPQGQLAEPLFTTDTYDLYIGKGSGGNQRFQKYIASGTSSQFLKGDGSLDSTTYQATSEKGQNNGYASLDAGGKIPVSQLPSSVIEYKGTWNASTNTPTLADGTGDAGDVYIVSVGGTQNLGSGSITFAAGDWVMYNGSVWQKSTGSNAVASVNGQTGIVVLDTDDISEPISATNLWFTNARARTAISLTTTGSSGMATYDNMTGVLNVPNYSISGLGGVPTSRQLTINGTAFDLSADRTWSVGTVTSVAALTIGTSGTDITSTVANGTTTPVITLNIPTASATNRGALSSADWSAFNGKQAALNGTGFVKISGTTISYDNTSYLSLAGGTMTGQLVLQNVTNSTDYTGGLRFPNDPFGGSGDISGLRLYRNGASGEKMTLELYVGNDGDDTINFATGIGGSANNDGVTINGNKIWNAGNLTPQTQLNGTGFVKASGTTITYDNTSYLPLSGGTLTGALSGTSSSMSSTSTATAFIPTGSTIPTNGMYLPSANTVAFAANSTRVIQISDSGRVSIGATTPTADTLTVHGAITTTNGGKITAQGMIEAGSTIFGGLNCIIVSDLSAASITPTGSTAPVNGMYLPSANTIAFSTLANPRLTIASNGAATFSSSVTAGAFLTNGASGTAGQEAIRINNDNGYIGFFNGANSTRSGYIQGNTTDVTIATSPSNPLIFATANVEKMRITSGGAVQAVNNLTANSPSGGNTGEGIIAGRSFKLDASGSGQTAKMFVVSNTLSDTYGSGLQIQFANLADTLGFGFNLNTSGGYETYMKSGGSWNRAMTITSGGRVGIGLTDPDVALVVAGSTNVASRIRASKTSSGVIEIGADRDTFNSPYISAITNSNLDFFTNDSHRMRITNGGNLLINTTDNYGFQGGALLHISKDQSTGTNIRISNQTNNASAAAHVIFSTSGNGWVIGMGSQSSNSGNNFYFSPDPTSALNKVATLTGAGVWSTSGGGTSDRRTKKNIQYITEDVLNKISALKPVEFEFLLCPNKKRRGFIAQDVLETTLSDLVLGNGDEVNGTYGLDYDGILALAIKAIQEQQAEIEELKSKLS